MTEPSELILSASSVKAYLDCGYRWYLSNVLRLPERPSMAMLMGTAVHAGAETYHKSLPLRPVEATRRAFEAEVGSVRPVEGERPDRGLPDALRAYETYQRNIVPTLGPPVLVEAPFAIRVDGTLVTGQVDFADADVHDTKTTETPSKVKAEYHRLQLSIYRHGYKALTGRWPGRLILDIIGMNGRWKQMEVDHDDREMADAVAVTAHGIREQRYEPTGATSGACRHCPYLETCTYAVTD